MRARRGRVDKHTLIGPWCALHLSQFAQLAPETPPSSGLLGSLLVTLRIKRSPALRLAQVVILLYLFDNDTSFVVLLSSVLGTGIELWKVREAVMLMCTAGRPLGRWALIRGARLSVKGKQ